jgi:hypothetical protein
VAGLVLDAVSLGELSEDWREAMLCVVWAVALVEVVDRVAVGWDPVVVGDWDGAMLVEDVVGVGDGGDEVVLGGRDVEDEVGAGRELELVVETLSAARLYSTQTTEKSKVGAIQPASLALAISVSYAPLSVFWATS